jgi:hypothetical protein
MWHFCSEVNLLVKTRMCPMESEGICRCSRRDLNPWKALVVGKLFHKVPSTPSRSRDFARVHAVHLCYDILKSAVSQFNELH